jgi:hypothetical protein
LITLIPVTVQILNDLTKHGIEVQALGDTIRYRPRSVMTPALLERLQANKADLLRLLDTEMAVAELRQSVDRYWMDPAWQLAWEQRFKSAQYANFASLRRVLAMVVEQAEAHHRMRDYVEFVSTCRFAHRLASGELWDEAGRTVDELRSDLTAWTI